MRYADHLTQVADILLSEQDGGEVRCNVGDKHTEEGFGSTSPLWGTDGFIAMPNAPSEDGACQALYTTDGQQKRIIATRDNRWASKAGALAPGDRVVVSDCEARIMLRREASQVVLYSADQTDDGATMMFELNGSTGVGQMVVGSSFLKMTKDKIQIGCGGTVLELDEAAFAVFAKHFAANVGGGNLGTIGPIAPPPGVGSVLAGVSGVMGAPSTKWTIST